MTNIARMHSRKHGKHGSHKPPKKKQAWVAYEKEEIEKLAAKLAKEGKNSSIISAFQVRQKRCLAERGYDICHVNEIDYLFIKFIFLGFGEILFIFYFILSFYVIN